MPRWASIEIESVKVKLCSVTKRFFSYVGIEQLDEEDEMGCPRLTMMIDGKPCRKFKRE